MKRRSPIVSGLVLALALVPVAHAAPPPSAQTEVNYLLEFVATSGCDFNRNGSWYDSRRAEAHLRHKYAVLAASNRINSAEDFIERAATKSSLSGQPYQVRCSGREVVPSNQWLREVLTRYRTGSAKGAPRSMRSAPGFDVSTANQRISRPS
jgi:hypothetical protein